MLNFKNAIQASGFKNTKFARGFSNLEEEKVKYRNQLFVFGILFFALVFGIVAVVLFSTNVSNLESYGEYFSSTGRKVGFAFGCLSLLALVTAGFMFDQDCDQKNTKQENNYGSPSIPSIISDISSSNEQYFTQTPRPPSGQLTVTSKEFQQPLIAPQNRQVPVAYPEIPADEPLDYPQAPKESPLLSTQSLSKLQSAIPALVNAAVPVGLAAINAEKGEKRNAAIDAAVSQLYK